MKINKLKKNKKKIAVTMTKIDQHDLVNISGGVLTSESQRRVFMVSSNRYSEVGGGGNQQPPIN